MASELPQGQALANIWGPYNDAGQAGGRVGYDGVTSIEIGRLAGPMGWFDVAVIYRGNGRGDVIMPLHMAETITIADAE